MNRFLGLTAIIASTFLFGACGGDGDSGAPVATYAVKGTVAYGRPVPGQSVQVTDSASASARQSSQTRKPPQLSRPPTR